MTTAGTHLAGRYRLTTRIASGGMGDVWLAHDELLGRDVAVKTLRWEYADDPSFLARFQGEARHSAGLGHPGIATVFDFGAGDEATDTPPYLVMEYVNGEPLSAILARDAPLPVDQVLDLVAQAGAALEAAHAAGVVHRDVKPGNLLVCADGTVKVTDFGIARAADATPLTQTGTVLGTAHYISPEQATAKPATPASDVYSLGVVAYEALAGHRPFEAATAVGLAMAHVHDLPPALPDTIPEPVRGLVRQALAKDPAERFASGGALAAAAASLRDGSKAAAGPATAVLPVVPAADAARPAQHLSRTPLWIALGVVLVLGAALGARALSSHSTTPTPTRTPTATRTSAAPGVQTKPVTVALIGMTSAEASQRLRSIGMVPRIEFVKVKDKTPGTVVGVEPLGTQIPVGSTVTLRVAKGKGDQGNGNEGD